MQLSSAQQYQSYKQQGWCVFEADPQVLEWVETALPCARKTVADPQNKHWFRHGNTWFAGVNILDNDKFGAVPGSGALCGEAINFIRQRISDGLIDLDKAQISVYYPGYPQPSERESAAAFGFRLNRDAAHVDGLLPIGPDRRRYLREHHQYVLAVPMVSASAGAAPFVIWRGSHHVMRAALQDHLKPYPVEQWPDIDLTNIYQSTRRHIFEQCQRVEVPLQPGQTLVAHRLALHGSAPWQQDASAGKDGRMICFFRPPSLTAEQWLLQP